jgi:hypothetical protein
MCQRLPMKALAVAGQNTVPANGGMRFVTLFTRYSGNRITDQGTVTLIQVGNSEVAVDEIWPRHPVRTAIRRAIDWIGSLRYSRGAHEPTSATMSGSCAPGRHETVDKQNLLGFEAIGLHENYGDTRLTMWRAPQLGCFPLLITTENRQPDGNFALASERCTIAIDRGR